nr:hypothetical protein CFP56_65580 [Quercus suber]
MLSPCTGELDGGLPRIEGCVGEMLTHASSAGTQFSEDSDPHGSTKKPLMVFPGTDEIGGVFSRSDGYNGKVRAVGGLPMDPNSSRVEVGCMGFSVRVAGGPAEDYLSSGLVLNSGGQPVNAEPPASLPLLVSEFSDMFHRHQLMGNNCFSSLSELGFDSKDDEIMLLD